MSATASIRRHGLRFITGGVVIGSIGTVGFWVSRNHDLVTVAMGAALGFMLGLIAYAIGVLVCDALGWVEL